MEGKGSFLVLLVVVTVLSICLAGVVGYLLVFGVQRTGPDGGALQAQTQNLKPQIDYKKVKKFKPFEKEPFTAVLKSAEGGKTSHGVVLRVELLIADAKAYEEISFREAEIKDFFISYFMNKTYEETSNPDNWENMKAEILKGLNERFPPRKGEKVNQKILEMSFEEWIVQ